MVAKLNRCIYGLKQSPREWYFRLVEYLVSYGFSVTTFDPCVLVHSSGDLILAIYVNDITLYGNSGKLVDDTVGALKREFKITDMGIISWLLSIHIQFTDEGITMSQTTFAE